MAGFEREPRWRVMDLAIRALGGPRGPRVEPGRARIPALRAQGCWFPRWRGAKCRHESSGGSGLPASCAPAGASARRRRSGRDPGCVGKVSGARFRQTHRLGLGGDELGGSLDRLGDDSATDGDLAGSLTGAADGLRVADGRHGEGSGHGGHVHEEAFSGAGVNTERSASTRRASQRVRAGSSSISLGKVFRDLDITISKMPSSALIGRGCHVERPVAKTRTDTDATANDVERSVSQGEKPILQRPIRDVRRLLPSPWRPPLSALRSRCLAHPPDPLPAPVRGSTRLARALARVQSYPAPTRGGGG